MPRGRVPENGESRDKVFSVRLGPKEVKEMDAARGTKPRSVFMRDAVKDASRKK
jgi:hypothetical protein